MARSSKRLLKRFQPAPLILCLSVKQPEESVLELSGHRPATAISYGNVVDLAYRSDFGCCAGHEDFIGGIELFTSNGLFMGFDAHCRCEFDDAVTGDTTEN